jgi:hypothetical protein
MDGKELSERTILAIDNFLHPQIFSEVVAELGTLRNWEPEVDLLDSQVPVGTSCNLSRSSKACISISQELKKLFKVPWNLDRIYVNRFQPGEDPRFHTDGEVLTCLLYADPGDWHIDDHGETQLLVNGEIRGVLPLPNRMLIFDGRLPHRATSFVTRQRHTIATKLENVTFADIILPGPD